MTMTNESPVRRSASSPYSTFLSSFGSFFDLTSAGYEKHISSIMCSGSSMDWSSLIMEIDMINLILYALWQ